MSQFQNNVTKAFNFIWYLCDGKNRRFSYFIYFISFKCNMRWLPLLERTQYYLKLTSMQLYLLITFSLFISMHIQFPLVINLCLRALPFFYFFFSLTPFSIWEWIRCFGISYVPAKYTSISAAKLPWIITSLSLSFNMPTSR